MLKHIAKHYDVEIFLYIEKIPFLEIYVWKFFPADFERVLSDIDSVQFKLNAGVFFVEDLA